MDYVEVWIIQVEVKCGLSDLSEAAAVDVVTPVTQVTEDHLVLVSRILYKKQVHVIVFHPDASLIQALI